MEIALLFEKVSIRLFSLAHIYPLSILDISIYICIGQKKIFYTKKSLDFGRQKVFYEKFNYY